MLLIPLVASQPAKRSYEDQRVSLAANGQTNQLVSLRCKLAAPPTEPTRHGKDPFSVRPHGDVRQEISPRFLRKKSRVQEKRLDPADSWHLLSVVLKLAFCLCDVTHLKASS